LDESFRKFLPMKEYIMKDSPHKRVIMIHVDHSKKNAVLFEKESQDVQRKDFDWCLENLVLVSEFNS